MDERLSCLSHIRLRVNAQKRSLMGVKRVDVVTTVRSVCLVWLAAQSICSTHQYVRLSRINMLIRLLSYSIFD